MLWQHKRSQYTPKVLILSKSGRVFMLLSRQGKNLILPRLKANRKNGEFDILGVAEISGKDYAFSMDVGIIYNKSAFKHGLSEADIEWAFLHPIRTHDMHDLV